MVPIKIKTFVPDTPLMLVLQKSKQQATGTYSHSFFCPFKVFMTSRNLFRTLSASTVQIVLNQFLGLVVFYLTSRFLSKTDYGELNWTIAFVSVITAIFSLGTDFIVLKRIASGHNIKQITGLHIFHNLAAGIVLVSALFITRHFFPGFFLKHYLLTSIGLSVLITFLSSPFKQLANGKEAFTHLAVMMISNNLVKGVLLSLLILTGVFQTEKVVQIFIVAAVCELAVSLLLARKKFDITLVPYFNTKKYFSLVKEALPQLGVMIFDSTLARVDWILLGIVAGASVTAEYSFAYKIFEISRLPMLILAPVILPKFVRYFSNEQLSQEKTAELGLLLRIEAFISVLIPIFFCITWVPLMNVLTAGKYSTSSELIYLLLAVSVPLHYFTNFLWTMAFAQRQMRLTFYITVAVSLFNVLLNVILIPLLYATGAAIAFSVSTVLQIILYKYFVKQQQVKVRLTPLIVSIIISAISVFIAKKLFTNVVISTSAGLLLYLCAAYMVKLIRKDDITQLKKLLSR